MPELVTEQAPCLKVTYPADGYAVISSLEDHFQFEIDVIPWDNNQEWSLPVKIEWFQVQTAKGSVEGDLLHQLNECRLVVSLFNNNYLIYCIYNENIFVNHWRKPQQVEHIKSPHFFLHAIISPNHCLSGVTCVKPLGNIR